MDYLQIQDFISLFAQFCGWAITIITLFTLVIPKTRNWCAKKIKKLIGYQELSAQIEKISDTTIALEKSVSELQVDFKEHLETEKIRDEALLVLLRDTIKREFQHYIDKGKITFEEESELEKMVNIYFTLGGNGTVKNAWEDIILKLPRA